MKFTLAPFAVAACVGVGWSVYQNSLAHSFKQELPPKENPIAVEVTRVEQRMIDERIELVGNLEAATEVELRARISGYITKLPLDVGDFVKENALVIELDDSKNQELVSRSEATLKVALAQLKASHTKQSQAEKEVSRYTRLAKSGVSTEQQQEQVLAQLAIAKAEVELEQARVDQAESDLLRSKLSLNETRIVAPISGFIAQRLVEVGDLAQPDVTMVRVVDLTRVRTSVHVVEKDYPKVEIGQAAMIQVDAFPGKTFSGKVVRKAPVLNPETRMAEIHIQIPNPETYLKPGMHARVSIIFNKRRQTTVIPIASLISEGKGEKSELFVIVGEPPRTERREVQTGLMDGEVVEILSGIKRDDRIVTLGNRLVIDGQNVTPVEPAYPQRNSLSAQQTSSRNQTVAD